MVSGWGLELGRLQRGTGPTWVAGSSLGALTWVPCLFLCGALAIAAPAIWVALRTRCPTASLGTIAVVGWSQGQHWVTAEGGEESTVLPLLLSILCPPLPALPSLLPLLFPFPLLPLSIPSLSLSLSPVLSYIPSSPSC